MRHDQNKKCIGRYENENVGVYAPLWVKGGLERLGKELDNVTFNIYEHSGVQDLVGSVNVTHHQFGLKKLQKIARNEELNVSGEYRPYMYAALEKRYEIIVALKGQ